MQPTTLFLIENGLEEYADIFLKEKLTIEILLGSNTDVLKDVLKDMIPQIGDRLKLINIVLDLQKDKINDNVFENLDLSIADTIIIDETGLVCEDGIQSEISKTAISEVQPTIMDTGLRVSTSSVSMVSNSLKRSIRKSDIENPLTKKQRYHKLFKENHSLESLLMSNIIGISIILKYNQKKLLDRTDRQKLVHLIIDKLMEANPIVSNDMFDEVSDNIVQMFTSEIKTSYYVKFNNGKRCVISGKLVDHYRNLKHYIKKCNVEPIIPQVK
jgi:hypothetical protein